MKNLFYLHVLFVACLCSFSGSVLAQNASAAAEKAYAVRTARAERRTIAQPLIKTGSLSAPATVDFSPRVSGRLVSTAREDGSLLEEGSRIKKGELIAAIDDREYKAREAAAAAALLSAQAQVEDKKREYARTEALLKDQTATEQEFDFAKTGLAVAEAEFARAQAALEEAKLNLADTRLYAPMDGVISAKKLYPGAMVSSSSVIYTITQMNPLRILLDVPTTMFSLLEKDKTGVFVTVDAYPGESVPLTIAEIFPTANENTRTVTVRMNLDNTSGKYTPGMYVRGMMALNERDNVLVVPYHAVVRRLQEYFVYRVIEGRAVVTPVKVGVRYDDMIEIEEGLELNEEIVTEGIHRLADGVKVNVFDR